jgi:hypothetical protein
LEDKPSKNLVFWGCPRPPNHEWHGGKDKALKLHLVDRRKLVNLIGGELPYDSVRNVVEGVDVPKLGKLSDMHFIY